MKVELRGITKRFPGIVANDRIDLVVEAGHVHSLLGENGAGKSTLMNVLFGLYRADEGEILLNGEAVSFRDPADAIAHGLGMVHQHFMLVPVFTVLDNLILGVEPTSGPFIDAREARQRIEELADQYGLHVPLDEYVENLPVGVQQRVEILKALYRGADCLILDEPTAVLTPPEIEDFFRIVHAITDEGNSVVFITHKLKEVLAISDEITVLRGGKVAGTTVPSETDELALAAMMVGHDVRLVVEKSPAEPGETVLSLRNVVVHDARDQPAVLGVDLDVRAGEIVAIAGVQGNGQTELVEAITGLRRPESGTITLLGRDVTHAGARELVERGVGHVPEDRQRDGLVAKFPVRDNLVLNTYMRPPWSHWLALDLGEMRDNAERLTRDFDVRPPQPMNTAGNLSGGNQQKVVVAREFSRDVTLLVASQPTRGLDVGSVQYIHEQIVAKRDQGVAVLVVSTELDEVLALGDRIAVMCGGRIVADIPSAEATREQIGLLMAGAAV